MSFPVTNSEQGEIWANLVDVLTSHNTIEYTHAKILVRALERQVSWDSSYDEVANHQCNVAYASK